MAMPRRIQLRRSKGWRKPEGAVVVSRPSKWGNPFRIEDAPTREDAMAAYRHFLRTTTRGQAICNDARRELRGKDLCCWCKSGDACHADVLLEVANA